MPRGLKTFVAWRNLLYSFDWDYCGAAHLQYTSSLNRSLKTNMRSLQNPYLFLVVDNYRVSPSSVNDRNAYAANVSI